MKKVFLVFPLIILTIYSCNNNEQEENININSNDSIVQKESEEENTKEYILPSAGQIAVIFKRANLKYISGICTEIKNDEVGGEFERALRLGIYSADLFYNILNNQWSESEKYFLKCKSVADKLGFNEIFSKDILNSLKKNINNTDSIIKTLSTIQYNIDNKVQTEEKEYITHIAFASAWIESMNIALQVYKKENNHNVSGLITEQVSLSNTLIQLLNNDKKHENKIDELIKIITKIMNNFNNLQSVKQNPDHDRIELSKEEFEVLSKSIEEAHQKLINL